MRSIPCRICRMILSVMAARDFFDLRNIMIRINIAKNETVNLYRGRMLYGQRSERK